MPVRFSAPRLVAVLALPVLAACGGGDAAEDAAPDAPAAAADGAAAPQAASPAAPAPGDAPDPCALMSPGEVQAAAGVEAAEGNATTSGGASVCTWTDASGRSAVVQVHPTADWYDRSKDAFELQYGGTAEDALGIGDDAYRITGTTGPLPTATVGVRRGTTSATVQVMAMDGAPPTLESQALELARLLAQKL
jgi:hypothetical protein